MVKKIKTSLNKLAREKTGQASVLMLILLLLGGIVIAPLLAYMGTGLKAGQVYEQKTDELYAADSGVDDALWRVKYNEDSLINPTPYDIFDYFTVWAYNLAEQVNDEDVAVTLQNVWIPKNIATPSPAQARGIIEGSGGELPRLTVAGSVPGTQSYQIRVDYYPKEEEDLMVQKIGIWLPNGFTYVDGSSNLEADPLATYYSVPVTEPYACGQAVVWSFGSIPFDDLPRADPADPPGSIVVTFEFNSSQPGYRPDAISWIKTSGVPDIPFSWSTDTSVYDITSVASNTTIETNVALSAHFSSLFDNAITSPGDVSIQPGSTVNGDVQYNGELDNKGDINGEILTDEIDWPSTEEFTTFYQNDVTTAPDPGSTIDIKDNPTFGPWYRHGNLTVKNTGGEATATLEGTIYVTGDLVFQQPGGPNLYTIDLNRQTIFCEGSINFPSDRCTVSGSGCIIAIGDVFFHPSIESDETSFVFVMSLGGEVDFNPMGDFYGSIAGDTNVDLQPGSTLNWRPPVGGLNYPGWGGKGKGGIGTGFTVHNWEIN